MNTVIIKRIYFLLAGLWTLMCLYGIYDTAIRPTNPDAYELSPLKMGIGFSLTALLAWLPLLILWLRRQNPKTATLEQTFARVSEEFYKESQIGNSTTSSHSPDDEDDDDYDEDDRHLKR